MSKENHQISDRLIKIETSQAHLSHDLEQINEVVIDHGNDLASLKRLIKALNKRLEALECKGKDGVDGVPEGME